jgi:hypothetical protein
MWVVYHWLKDTATGETIIKPCDTVMGDIGDKIRLHGRVYEIVDLSSEYEDFYEVY